MTTKTIGIGTRLLPKRGRAGKPDVTTTCTGRPKDFVRQAAVVRQMHRPDNQAQLLLDDGTCVTLGIRRIKKDWVIA